VAALRKRLEREAGGDDVGAGATVFLGYRKAEEPELAERVPHGSIETARYVTFRGPRLDDARGEVPHRLVERELLLAVPEVHRATLAVPAGIKPSE
jgi:hypothetical protein